MPLIDGSLVKLVTGRNVHDAALALEPLGFRSAVRAGLASSHLARQVQFSWAQKEPATPAPGTVQFRDASPTPGWTIWTNPGPKMPNLKEAKVSPEPRPSTFPPKPVTIVVVSGPPAQNGLAFR